MKSITFIIKISTKHKKIIKSYFENINEFMLTPFELR